MSRPRKKSTGAKARQTKEVILKELEVTQRLLIEKEEELVVCQEELAHMIELQQEARPSEQEVVSALAEEKIEALQDELNTLKRSEGNSNAALQAAQKRIEELEASLENAEASARKTFEADVARSDEKIDAVKAEINQLKSAHHKAEANANAALKAAQDQVKEVTKSMKAAEKRLQENEILLKDALKNVARLNSDLGEKNLALEESVATVALLEEEIEGLQKAEKESVDAQQNPDVLPLPEAGNQEMPEEAVAEEALIMEETLLPVAEATGVSSVASSSPAQAQRESLVTTIEIEPSPAEVATVPIRIQPITELVQQNEPFTASITIDLEQIAATNSNGFNCQTRLFAKRLTDGKSQLIGEETAFYDGSATITAQMNDLVLNQGMYYLQAVAAFSTLEGHPVPIVAIHEGDLLQVIS